MLRRREDILFKGTAMAGLAAAIVLVCAVLLAGPAFLSGPSSSAVPGPDAAFSQPLFASTVVPDSP